VATLSAKTEVSVTPAIARRTNSVPTVETTPIVVGFVEARGEAAHLDLERAGGDQWLDPFRGDPTLVLDVQKSKRTL
jgi:hypothetical protein